MNSKPTKPPSVGITVRGDQASIEHARQNLHQDWYTVKEVARLLGRHEKTVRAWIKGGTLKHYRPTPRSTRVTKEQLAQFISLRNISVPLE